MLGLGMVNTLWLILPANVLAIIVGTLAGLVAAWRRGTTIDAAALAIGLILWAVPTFFMGIILLFLGAAWFDLPTAGKQTIGAEYGSFWEAAGDLVRHLLMPTLTFTLVLLGEYLLIRADERSYMQYFAAVAAQCRSAGVKQFKIGFPNE